MPHFSYTDPQRTAMDEARLSQGDRRITLQEANLALTQAKQAESATLQKIKAVQEIQSTISATIGMRKMADLNPEDKNFARDYSNILAAHSDAGTNKAFQEVAGGLKERWVQYSAAQDILARQREEDLAKKTLEDQKTTASKPFDTALAAEHLSTALGHLDEIARTNFGREGKPPIPPELQNAKTYLTKTLESLVAPAATTSTTASATAAPVTAAPAAPIASPTPTQISTSDASSFLQKALGQAAPSPTATPQVQATPAGLPDAASAALNPDETTD